MQLIAAKIARFHSLIRLFVHLTRWLNHYLENGTHLKNIDYRAAFCMRRAKYFHFRFVSHPRHTVDCPVIIISIDNDHNVMKCAFGLFILRVLFVKSTMPCAITITIAQSWFVGCRSSDNRESKQRNEHGKNDERNEAAEATAVITLARCNSTPNGMRKFELRPTSIQTKTSLSSRWGHFSTHFPKTGCEWNQSNRKIKRSRREQKIHQRFLSVFVRFGEMVVR